LTSILDETCDSDTNLTSSIAYSTKFIPVDAINLTSWFDQIDVRTIMVPIENNRDFIENIKSSISLYILELKS
jgi:hypothetical protein